MIFSCVLLMCCYFQAAAYPLMSVPDAELVHQPNISEILAPPLLESSLEAFGRDTGNAPNFFWIGSGDGDNGITYWVTTTVYKTRTLMVTLTLSGSTEAEAPAVTETDEGYTATLWPLEPSPCSTEAVTSSPWNYVDPRFWIRTVFQSESDEKSGNFTRLVEERLRKLYAKAAAFQPERTKREAPDSSREIHVHIQNISRPYNDLNVHIVYAVARGEPSDLVAPDEAVRIVREYATQAPRLIDEFCSEEAEKAARICRDVIVEAEPYLAVDRIDSGGPAPRYWIIAAAFGATFFLIIVFVLVYIALRKYKSKKAGLNEISPALPNLHSTDDTKALQNTNSFNGQSAEDLENRLSPSQSEDRFDNEEPLESLVIIRKSRSTSRKRGRRRRPQTAPIFKSSKSKSKSSSDLSIKSCSSSERNEFVKCCEESYQPSRGCRSKKKKKRNFYRENQSEIVKSGGSVTSVSTSERDSALDLNETLPSDLRTTTNSRRNNQGLSLAHLDVVDNVQDPEEAPAVTKSAGWKPGSLVPTRVSSAVASRLDVAVTQGMQRPVSSPAPLLVQRNAEKLSTSGTPRQAWVSSEMTGPASVERESLGEESAGNLMHVHSQSYPAWPSLARDDPAVELINVIKEELKKFDTRHKKC